MIELLDPIGELYMRKCVIAEEGWLSSRCNSTGVENVSEVVWQSCELEQCTEWNTWSMPASITVSQAVSKEPLRSRGWWGADGKRLQRELRERRR